MHERVTGCKGVPCAVRIAAAMRVVLCRTRHLALVLPATRRG
jgi:hypothetical protein